MLFKKKKKKYEFSKSDQETFETPRVVLYGSELVHRTVLLLLFRLKYCSQNNEKLTLENAMHYILIYYYIIAR